MTWRFKKKKIIESLLYKICSWMSSDLSCNEQQGHLYCFASICCTSGLTDVKCNWKIKRHGGRLYCTEPTNQSPSLSGSPPCGLVEVISPPLIDHITHAFPQRLVMAMAAKSHKQTTEETEAKWALLMLQGPRDISRFGGLPLSGFGLRWSVSERVKEKARRGGGAATTFLFFSHPAARKLRKE